LTNPSLETFLSLVHSARQQLFAAPFVKDNVARLIFERKPENSKISLLTSYKLSNFHRRSSDIEALRTFISHNARVRNYPSLHAKLYIFDSKKAIITSGNLTIGGLKDNYECGILTDDRELVLKLEEEFLKVFNDEDKVSVVSNYILALTEEILAKVPSEKRIKFEKSERDLFPTPVYEPEDDMYDGGVETIRDSLSGWRLDMFNVVSQISANVFSLEQAYSHKDILQKKHPDNRNVEAKIRQQLQELRDLGLLEFCGRGIYRKLWKSS
jgi:type II restriction enzyme